MPKGFRATMLERAIGRQLAGWRHQRHLSLSEACQRVGFSTAKLSMMENAVQSSAPMDVMALGYVYQVPVAEWQELVRRVQWAQHQRLSAPADDEVSFDAALDYASVGSEVTRLRVFHSDLLPNVFRTDEYALATINADDPIRAPVVAHQQAIARSAWRARIWEKDPLTVEAVFNEAVIRQVVGGTRVMKAQLMHLIELCELPNVTIQIIARDAGAYPAMGSPFTLLSFPHRQHDDVVYVENIIKGEYIEDRNDCELCQQRFASLQRVALCHDDSVELVAEVAGGRP